jgi:hypothetical protein
MLCRACTGAAVRRRRSSYERHSRKLLFLGSLENQKLVRPLRPTPNVVGPSTHATSLFMDRRCWLAIAKMLYRSIRNIFARARPPGRRDGAFLAPILYIVNFPHRRQ